MRRSENLTGNLRDFEMKEKIDFKRIEKAVGEILAALGEDGGREGLRDTPMRVARMYGELLGGREHDPKEYLQAVFRENYDEVVLLRDIPFYSICEHHMMPFIGKAHVAYLPDGQVIGVSKLARVVDCFSHRLQVQERLTGEIADFLMDNLQPKGAAVVIEAAHSCMTIRGAKKAGSVMVTRSRSEVLGLMHGD